MILSSKLTHLSPYQSYQTLQLHLLLEHEFVSVPLPEVNAKSLNAPQDSQVQYESFKIMNTCGIILPKIA